MVIFPSAVGLGDHDNCIVDLASELFSKGYRVFLEYPFYLGKGKNNTKLRVVVDIYALKMGNEIIAEVGTLSLTHTNGIGQSERIQLLKKLCPKAKIIHITQWKNWINQFEIRDYQNEIYMEKLERSGVFDKWSDRTW